MADDPINDVWHVLRQHVGAAEADRELLELRRKWGGVRLYFRMLPAFHRSETSHEPGPLPERKAK